MGWASRPTCHILPMNPSSSGHRREASIAYGVLMRSSSAGIDRTHDRAVAARQPLVERDIVAAVEAPSGEALLLEQDDHFQWFVDLFVAEYASEATPRLNVPN